MGKGFDKLIRTLADISGLFVAFIVLSVCSEVVTRYLLGRPLSWTVEITEYLQLYLAFFSAAAVLKEGGHVTLDLFVRSMPPRARRVLDRIANLLGASATGTIFIFSSAITYETFMTGVPVVKTLEVPKWLVLLPVSFGCLLLTIEFLRRVFAPPRPG